MVVAGGNVEIRAKDKERIINTGCRSYNGLVGRCTVRENAEAGWSNYPGTARRIVGIPNYRLLHPGKSPVFVTVPGCSGS